MTHEGLLDKLADIAHENDAHEARNYFLLSLLAVVKLHNPESVMTPCPEGRSGCAVIHYADRNSCSCGFWNYPCPTIQAIEKELM